jgi:hypothetical protein
MHGPMNVKKKLVEYSASHPCRFTPGRVGGSHNLCGRFGEEVNCLPPAGIRTVSAWSSSPARGAVAVPSALSRPRYCNYSCSLAVCCRLRLICAGTRTETRFRLSAKRTSPFISAGGVSSVYCQPRCAHQR